MNPIRVLSIIGTRPEAVKMAPVLLCLSRNAGIESRVCATAQHRQMLDQILNRFGLAPDIDLDAMRPGQSLGQLAATLFSGLEAVLQDQRPDWILAQGDTSTVLVAALSSYYHRIRFGHVEAGLRTGDKWNPFPEEAHRRMAGLVADLHFAPTEGARQNLLHEHIPESRILVTGSTEIDTLRLVAGQPASAEETEWLNRCGLLEEGRLLVLATVQCREHFGLPLESICRSLRCLAEAYRSRIRLVFPMHLNPHVQEPARRFLGGTENILLLPPLDYLSMIHLMKRAALLLSDSGGLQEAACALGVPMLVLREITERPEGVLAGKARLVGTDPARILSEACRLLDDPEARAAMTAAAHPYGDGHAAERIVAALLEESARLHEPFHPARRDLPA